MEDSNLFCKIFDGKGSQTRLPICVLPGFLHSSKDWLDTTMNHLIKFTSSKVILIDLPGHGGSSEVVSEKNTLNFEFITQTVQKCLTQFLNKEIISDSPIMIGESFGGRICMHLALKYPLLVSKLIILDVGMNSTNNPILIKENLQKLRNINLGN